LKERPLPNLVRIGLQSEMPSADDRESVGRSGD
jgi:hypothetical protein